MSETSVTALANDVRSAAMALLWRQWRAVGASVSASGAANALVDPEALIMMSLWMLDHEQRLADVAGSWITVNSALVSIQRLRNLRDDFPTIAAERLSALAKVAIRDGKNPRWESLELKRTLDLGLRANKTRAAEVPLRSWATLMFQLRRGMGVGAKADALAFVLATNATAGDRPDWASVSMIAEAISYTSAAVRRVADDLAAARFIRSLETVEGERRAQRMYSARTVAWLQLLEIGTHQPGWAYWRERFLFIIALLDWLAQLEKKSISAYARDVRAREILERHRAALLQDRVVDKHEFAAAELNFALLEKAARSLCTSITNRG